MSNLTSASASGEASGSSGNRIEAGSNYPQQNFTTQQPQALPAKKKRNLPGNPDPGAEVIALSPKTLMATNRFVCEICNKGFQRDQNLQLHRRGHNLPWKLKQRTSKEVRKKVYVCPEANCVHHDPSRALGDLTGIKKHFSRKHGEKKWKCEKCSKKYAVQSDWKAHSKICGTREYRCDCGTLFSRRDSFITHRAFCEALAVENARPNPFLFGHQQGTNNNTTTAGFGLDLPSREQELHVGSSGALIHGLPPFGNSKPAASIAGDDDDDHHHDNVVSGATPSLLQDMIDSLSSATGFVATNSFDDLAFGGGILNTKKIDGSSINESFSKTTTTNATTQQSEGLTRDFLGLTAFSHADILDITGPSTYCIDTSDEQRDQSQKPWQG
ncbi:protein indeterminate-domain 7-like isoform X2 [Hibiscus syriacus]|uniref:protein indeterminate-domain 7-like isoform X2 n=1 Tax=Hibiscus syriacus TaxID=106335 RepID=UPI001922D568|nr:protein indeterminate-domain 7-like isoform X2 [Hibiscus syriacus]